MISTRELRNPCRLCRYAKWDICVTKEDSNNTCTNSMGQAVVDGLVTLQAVYCNSPSLYQVRCDLLLLHVIVFNVGLWLVFACVIESEHVWAMY